MFWTYINPVPFLIFSDFFVVKTDLRTGSLEQVGRVGCGRNVVIRVGEENALFGGGVVVKVDAFGDVFVGKDVAERKLSLGEKGRVAQVNNHYSILR